MRSRGSRCTRRTFLRGAGTASLLGAAGCLGVGGGDGGGIDSGGSSASPAGSGTTGSSTTGGGGGGNEGGSTTIAILAAGSFQNALENGLRSAVDVPIAVEAHGSATVARLIAEGQRDPDIVTVADTALFNRPLDPPWYSVVTSNAVVIAYNQNTEGGRRIAEAGPDGWYEPILDGSVDIGRTDPDQDPLGYRALFTLDLASRYYDASNLRERIPTREQIYPETALISNFETGAIDAAIAYRNMAVERDYEYIDLPDRIDLSNPRYSKEWYSTTAYTLPSGQEIRGGLIAYGSTIRHMSDAALDVFEVHTTGEYLDEFGFLPREQFPTYEGDVPARVERATGRSDGGRSVASDPATSAGSAVSDITILI